MTAEGTVINGVIVLDQEARLPEGARVQVTLAENGAQATLKSLLKHAGSIQDMPSDFAHQHDHYIHGTPKR